jgi:hypothetical protein
MVERLPNQMGKPKPLDPTASARLTAGLARAVDVVYPQLAAAYSPISYRGGDQPVFTNADRAYLETGPSTECCSDNDPFELSGIPNVTFSGNYDFYRSDAKPWSYPFDQPVDTFSTLACDTGGSPRPSKALEAALDLPYALSYQLIQTYAPPARGQGVGVFSTPAQSGKPVQFTAVGKGPIRWDFGDHATSTQRSPSHTYARPGTYHIQLRFGSGTIRWTLTIPSRPPAFHLFFGTINPPPIHPWHPDQLQKVAGCH